MTGIGIGAGLGVLADGRLGLYAPGSQSTEFFGVTDVDFGDFAQADIAAGDAKTVGVWARCLENATARILVGKWDAAASLGWALLLGASSDLQFIIQSGPADYIQRILDAAASQDARWALFCATYDGSSTAAGIKLYVNGVQPASSVVEPGILAATASGTSLLVGSDAGAAYEMDDARLCHSFIIDRELTPEEVLRLASRNQPGRIGDMVSAANIHHWCTLGNGCAVGAGNFPDLSSLSNDGTFSGAAEDIVDDYPPTEERSDYSPLTESTVFQSDAANEKVEHPKNDANTIEKDEAFTLFWWMKTSSVGQNKLLGRYNSGWFGDGDDQGYSVHHNGAGAPNKVTLYLKTEAFGGGATSFFAASRNTPGINDGAWHLFAFAYNGNPAAPTIVSQLDGSYTKPLGHTTSGGALTNGTMVNATKTFEAGAGYDDSFYNYWDGQLCHVGIYKGVDLDKFDLYRMWGDGGHPQNLATQAEYDKLVFWCTYGDGCSVAASGFIDLIAANNGSPTNMEGGDLVADVPP